MDQWNLPTILITLALLALAGGIVRSLRGRRAGCHGCAGCPHACACREQGKDAGAGGAA